MAAGSVTATVVEFPGNVADPFWMPVVSKFPPVPARSGVPLAVTTVEIRDPAFLIVGWFCGAKENGAPTISPRNDPPLALSVNDVPTTLIWAAGLVLE